MEPRNVPDEPAKLINFFKSWPLSTQMFTTVCDKIESPHLAAYQSMTLSKKSTCGTELGAKLATFSWNTIFTWKGTDRQNYGYLVFDVWQAFSQKWTKWACHLNKNS